MTLEEARRIVGNQSRKAVANMVYALSLHSWSNTPEEQRRLIAGRVILRNTRN